MCVQPLFIRDDDGSTTRDARFIPTTPRLRASAEQQAVIQAIGQGHNAIVIARAGTGKTSTCLLVAHAYPRKIILILTYNKKLQEETEAGITQWRLQNIRCTTIHAQVGECDSANRHASDDEKLQAIVKSWSKGAPMFRLSQYDLIIIDEVQDMRPSYYSAIRRMLPRRTQLVILGDPNQLVYTFGGEDAADVRYLLSADEFFGAYSACSWVKLSLTLSYRLTPKLAKFVNTMWGTDIVGANSGPNQPIEYWHLDLYREARKVCERVQNVLDSNPASDVLILLSCNVDVDDRRHPVKDMINELSTQRDTHGRLRYTFHMNTDLSSHYNKTRVWTFHSSKGCTSPIVIVFGFDAYRSRQPTLNPLCVGLSRASRHLIVVHSKSWDKNTKRPKAAPYVHPLNRPRLAALVNEGVVVCPDGIPADETTPLELESKILSPTEATRHVDCTTARRLLDEYTVVKLTVPPAHTLHFTTSRTCHTSSHTTEEDNSPVFGKAVPFAVEYARNGIITEVEAMFNPVHLGSKSTRLTLQTTLNELSAQGITLSRIEVWQLERFYADFSDHGGRVGVMEVVRFLRCNQRHMPSLSNCGYGFTDRPRKDSLFRDKYLHHVREAYHTKGARTLDVASLMVLANAAIAFANVHAASVQRGMDNFDWMNRDHLSLTSFHEAVAYIDSQLPGEEELGATCDVDFEHSLSTTIEPPACGPWKVYKTIHGSVDAITEDYIFEFKLCASLSVEHELQSALYAAMRCLDERRESATTLLINARTGEQRAVTVNSEHAAQIINETAQLAVAG